MTSRVEQVLAKLGIEHRRHGNRVWAEWCPLPTHAKHNQAHRWQNFFIRADRGEWSGYWCFSCKNGGNLVELVMLAHKLDFREALDWVRTVGEQEVADPFLRVRAVLDLGPGALTVPAGVEKRGEPLAEWNSVPAAYVRSRGITDDQVRRWGIGYALSGRLADRVFLPVLDARGRLANYAARSFVGAEKRYLAAGSWENPDKVALFGEHRWHPKERDAVVVVEGALNGLAIERAMLRAGVAADLAGMSGLDENKPGEIDVRTLSKLGTFRRVVVATDPDPAGDRAAAGLEASLGRYSDVVRLRGPDGADACDLPEDALAADVARALGQGAASGAR